MSESPQTPPRNLELWKLVLTLALSLAPLIGLYVKIELAMAQVTVNSQRISTLDEAFRKQELAEVEERGKTNLKLARIESDVRAVLVEMKRGR